MSNLFGFIAYIIFISLLGFAFFQTRNKKNKSHQSIARLVFDILLILGGVYLVSFEIFNYMFTGHL